jgi:hypothetical protein
MHALNEYVREQDPDRLIFSSSARLDPRGPVAREIFYDRSFDVMAPHFYGNASEEPQNNPAFDKKVLPAIETALLTSYWMSHATAHRPLLNGEWGLTAATCPGGRCLYGPGFTQQEDEALFRTVSWTGFATGQIGQGLRLTGDELTFNLNALTAQMGNVQRALSAVGKYSLLAPALPDFAAAPLAGRITATSAAGAALLVWGVSDGTRGLVYVLQDGNRTSGTVSDARVVVVGLDPAAHVDVQYWATAGAASTPIASQSASASDGTLTLTLPPFGEDVAIVFAP